MNDTIGDLEHTLSKLEGMYAPGGPFENSAVRLPPNATALAVSNPAAIASMLQNANVPGKYPTAAPAAAPERPSKEQLQLQQQLFQQQRINAMLGNAPPELALPQSARRQSLNQVLNQPIPSHKSSRSVESMDAAKATPPAKRSRYSRSGPGFTSAGAAPARQRCRHGTHCEGGLAAHTLPAYLHCYVEHARKGETRCSGRLS